MAAVTSDECSDYVTCEIELIKAINAYNDMYYSKMPNQSGGTGGLVDGEISGKLLAAINRMNSFLVGHSKDKNMIGAPATKARYDKLVDQRKLMKQNIKIINSMNGAPKEYNEVNNIYDDYRDSYNVTIYLSVIISLLAVVLLYVYYNII
jgi:hypothetical protein